MKSRSILALRKADLLAGVAALALALLVYRPLLMAPAQQALPWGSDTLGHVLKASYLKSEIRQGRYPTLFPFWYLGLDMLRYHPPLPYVLLAALSALSGGDMIRAAHWLVALSAGFGSWGGWWYRRWVGNRYASALMLGLLLLPDNVRVALAEGNLPRSVAAALLPWAIYLLLRALEPDALPRHRLLLSLLFTLLVLSHAMMAAIYALGSAAIVLLSIFHQRVLPRRALAALASIVLGLALAAWWLLPSLSGGLAALPAKALAEAQPAFPLTHYLKIEIWHHDPESIYLGVALLLGSLALLLVRRAAAPLPLLLPAWLAILVTTPTLRPLFDALPLHQMLWPLRFLGMSSFLLWLAVAWPPKGEQERFRRWQTGLIVLILLEQTHALRLIHTRPEGAVWEIARTIHNQPGWREATLDESRLGSEAAYVFSAISAREQVFGWAFQGARNARYLASLNDAARLGALDYLMDRLQRMGVDDVVLTADYPQAPDILARLLADGYRPLQQQGNLALLHRDGSPRALVADWQVVGIGESALNGAFLFPQITVAESPFLDDYTVDSLAAYRVVYLDGFRWHRRADAEALVTDLARRGVQVVLEISGVPLNPIAHAPYFLGVWGEQIILDHAPLQAQWNGRRIALQPFARPGQFWYAYVPQGEIQPALTFGYLGETAILAGYRPVGAGGIWFLGGNLVYHTLTTQDPQAASVLESLLTVPARQSRPLRTIPLLDYRPHASGYTFRIQVERPTRVLIPVAAQEGMRALVDERRVPYSLWEGMPMLQLPPGTHNVSLTVTHQTELFWAGRLVSLLALILLSRWAHIWRGV